MTRATAALGVLLLLTAACGRGEDSGAKVSTAVGSDAEWTRQVLTGEVGPDQPTQIAVDDDRIVVVTVSDEGTIAGFATDKDGRFVAGEPVATGHRPLFLGGVTRFGDDWLTLGSGGLLNDEELLFEMHAFTSPDGRTWTEVGVTGLDAPADVSALVAVDDGVVAAGSLRTAGEPASGGFRPVVWHSADGTSWSTVLLPTGNGSEGSVAAVADTGSELLAVGGIDGRGVLWSSSDGGRSWSMVEREGVPQTFSLNDIAAQDGVVVMSGAVAGGAEDGREGTPLLSRSTDGGLRWQEVSSPPPTNRVEAFATPLFGGGGNFFALTSSFIQSWAEPELCYADIELCRQGSAVTLYFSEGGDRWSRVDTSGIADDEFGEIDQVVAADDGGVHTFRRVEEGTEVSTWPAGLALPTMEEPDDPSTSANILGDDEQPVPGRRYGVPLYIHCGMDWLYLGGEPWQRTDDGSDTETGAGDEVPDHWPVAQQTIFGFATMVSDDLIEYSLTDGEVIATYAPATVEPPGCD